MVRVRHSDGGEFSTEARTAPVAGVEAGLMSVVIVDLTDRQRLDAMLEFNTFHDPLTGLPNRTLLMEHLHGELQQCARTRSMLAVFLIDIDEMEAESGIQHVSN